MECPHCQNQIEVPDLWEFFDCASCGASLQLENNELKILKDPNENTSTNYEQKPQQEENSPMDNFISEEAQENPTEPPVESYSNAQAESTPNNFSEISGDHTPSSSSEDLPQNQNEQMASTPDVSQSSSSEKSENLSNILNFGNSPNQKNHFTYHLQINGISSKVLFDKIRHILKSPRVKLDCPNQATNNTLTVNNLNAVQMVYLVRKLSPLSVQIHWTQKSTLTE